VSHIVYPTIDACIGQTPLVLLQRLNEGSSNTILLKLEGNNPAGSVKDRAALSMIVKAEQRGHIQKGDTLIEATSGNTGIALAMVAAIKGYRMILIMPDNLSMEGKGKVLNQFANDDNPLAHYETTGPEIWQQTQGQVTHFVSSMGTTGTIMGTSRFLKEQNKEIQIVGLQPKEGASIPGIRRWPEKYMPSIFDASRVDQIIDIGQQDAEKMMKALATKEGIFAGVSSGGSVAGALQLSAQVENATIVAIICDRGDRYLSTGVFA
jgi:cysteine synthase B